MIIESDAAVTVECRAARVANGFEYTITHNDPSNSCCPGRALMVVKQVNSYLSTAHFQTNNIYNECCSRGLCPEDKVGHIRMFYPNGDLAKKHQMRHGAGSIVLKRIVNDLIDHKGKVLYTLPTTDCMVNFLKKHNFTPCSMFPDHYYLYLF